MKNDGFYSLNKIVLHNIYSQLTTQEAVKNLKPYFKANFSNTTTDGSPSNKVIEAVNRY